MASVRGLSGKKVMVTGHTGFKGSWLCAALKRLNAQVCGYSLGPRTMPSLYRIMGLDSDVKTYYGDIRDQEILASAIADSGCEIVLHLAAQPIVRESYRRPVDTYDTNVMGTVNVLDAVRQSDTVRAVVIVTTDKVYHNNEWHYPYRETDSLDGYDPYSNSKSCAELVALSYARSFLDARGVKVATARAGNVIGGGDWSVDRIIPDCVRAAERGLAIPVRNPCAIRPYQHVLEALYGYLLLADKGAEGAYNIGPDDIDCVPTGKLVDLFCKYWPGASWNSQEQADVMHEANFLKLDSSRIRAEYGYMPRWHIDETVKRTVELYRGGDPSEMRATAYRQIDEYFGTSD